MQKTDNFFVISNHNYDPRHLLEYCQDYIIYDQSGKQEYKEMLVGTKVVHARHSGHNISDYFTFFIEHYGDLPKTIALIKGNIFPRHMSKEFFERTYTNKYYTFLFERPEYRQSNKRAYFLSSENQYLEFNNSWFIKEHPHWYFQSFNELLSFVYKNPVLPRYNLFSPGACYILCKAQVLKNSKEFYKNIYKIISYTNPVNPFPSEAHQIEWLCHLIYTATYDVHDYMNNEEAFSMALRLHCRRKKIGSEILDSSILAKTPRRILIIGIHEWDELNIWIERYPDAEVMGSSILAPFGQKSTLYPDRIAFLYGPIKELLHTIDQQDATFDLIIYEGYHLKGESEILGRIIDKTLTSGGICFVSDVLSIPLGYMRRIAIEAEACTVTATALCANDKSDIAVLKVVKRTLCCGRYVIRGYNVVQSVLGTLRWGRRNIFKYLKQKLPV